MKRKQPHITTAGQTNTQDDVLGFGHHRFNTSYFASYGLLFGGMLIFDWDPLYIYLSIAFELIISVCSYLYKLWARVPFIKSLITSIFVLPTLIIAVSHALYAYHKHEVPPESGGFWASTGVLVYVGLAVYNTVMHFQRSTLKFMRFMDDMNAKYAYEGGRPMIADNNRIAEAIMNTWMLTFCFLFAWYVSILIGTIGTPLKELPDHFVSKAGAIIILILTMAKDLIAMFVYEKVYPRGEDQEMRFVKMWAYKDKVYLRATGEQMTFEKSR